MEFLIMLVNSMLEGIRDYKNYSHESDKGYVC